MESEKRVGAIPVLAVIALILLVAAVFAVYFEDQLFGVQVQSNKDLEMQALQVYVDKEPYNQQAWVNLGWLYYTEGEYAHAKEKLEQAVELDPESQVAFYNLGLVYMELEEYEAAEKSLLRSLDLARHPDTLYVALGEMYLRKGDYDKALEYLEQGENWLPTSPDVYLRMEIGRASCRERV